MGSSLPSTRGEVVHPCNVAPLAAILHRRRTLHRFASVGRGQAVLEEAMKEPLSDGLGAFAMLPIGGDQNPVVEALQHRRVLARDLAVLWLLITHLDWRTGRCWITSTELAGVLGHTRTEEVLLTLGRLRKEGLVARGSDKRDPRRRFYCLNPAVAATGGPHRRRLQLAQFLAALE